MMERIEVQKVFSVKDCKENPSKTYVFGDNLMYQGTRGQAIIRYCPNAFGIPTKRKPSMNEDAFFSDQESEKRRVSRKLIELLAIYENDGVLVFPLDGIGTGLAKLKEKSPDIYNLISDFFKDQFGLEIMR